MASLQRVLAKEDLRTADEAEQFINGVGRFPEFWDTQPETASEKAQQLAYDAWEAPSFEEEVALAKQALEIDPGCADAYKILADNEDNGEQRIGLYRQAVAAGKKSLNPKTFKNDVGHFWGIFETRPYMRALFGLATTLWEEGERGEAVKHARELLRLNPNDNQGVRDVVVPWLLEMGDDGVAQKILGDYPGDVGAMHAYAMALVSFRQKGDIEPVRRLVRKAIESNVYMPGYLTGALDYPDDIPDMFQLESKDEAIIGADQQLMAWLELPRALTMLRHEAKRLIGNQEISSPVSNAIARKAKWWASAGIADLKQPVKLSPTSEKKLTAVTADAMHLGADVCRKHQSAYRKTCPKADKTMDAIASGIWTTLAKDLENKKPSLMDGEIVNEMEEIGLELTVEAAKQTVTSVRLEKEDYLGSLCVMIRGAMLYGFCLEMARTNEESFFTD